MKAEARNLFEEIKEKEERDKILWMESRMDAEALKVFEGIKEKAEQDKIIWNQAQNDESITISPEKEDEIMERMFSVHYIEQYLKALNKIDELEQQLSEAEGAIGVFRED